MCFNGQRMETAMHRRISKKLFQRLVRNICCIEKIFVQHSLSIQPLFLTFQIILTIRQIQVPRNCVNFFRF